MTEAGTGGEAQPLWPDGTPGAETADAPEPERTPRLTPYLVPRDAPGPAVVVGPGGGYGRRAPHEGEPVARWLNTLGISAFVLDYRVAPYRHPYPLLDAQHGFPSGRHGLGLATEHPAVSAWTALCATWLKER